MLSFIVHLTLIVGDWMKNREQEGGEGRGRSFLRQLGNQRENASPSSPPHRATRCDWCVSVIQIS